MDTLGPRSDEGATPLAAGGTLEETLDWVNDLGTRHGIPFLLDSGSLLGLARQGRFLSGDYDLDLTVLGDDSASLLFAGLPKGTAHAWRYDRRIYKIDIDGGANGPPVTVDVKFFQRIGESWVCPAIGARASGGANTRRASRIRRVLRPLWCRWLRRGDAACYPLRALTRVDSWVVPARYFDETIALGGRRNCRGPKDLSAYLTYRYGDWRCPTDDWVSSRDDGAYHNGFDRRLAKVAAENQV